jgi:hypothetical protein
MRYWKVGHEIDPTTKRRSGSARGVLPAHPWPYEVGDELAKLFAIAKPEGIRFAKGLPNSGVAGC